MTISGAEAHMLLFALDKYLESKNGKIQKAPPGYSFKECQDLRDKLFNNHEHPNGEEDDDWKDMRNNKS